WVQFRVDSAAGINVGLAEIEAYGPNLARRATVSVSSEAASTGQLGIKAIDGIVDGYPGDYTKEWATILELGGAWIRLTWSSAVTISQVILHDRINNPANIPAGPHTAPDHILAGTLLFSDGTSLAVGALPDDGTGF